MAAEDTFVTNRAGLSSPADNAAAVTPHDDNDLSYVTRGIMVGVAGNIVVNMQGGQTTTIAVIPGTIYPLRVTRVKATSTTATGIVAIW